MLQFSRPLSGRPLELAEVELVMELAAVVLEARPGAMDAKTSYLFRDTQSRHCCSAKKYVCTCATVSRPSFRVR